MKTSTLTGLFLLITVFALAQNKFPLTINTQFGVQLGSHSSLPNAAFIDTHFESQFDFSPTMVYGVGLSFDYPLTKQWIARSGMMLLNTRADIHEYNVYGGAHDINMSFNDTKNNSYFQVQIPLSIRVCLKILRTDFSCADRRTSSEFNDLRFCL